MLRYIFTLIVLCTGIATISAQDNSAATQLKYLHVQETQLQAQLKAEMAQRNITQDEASISTLDEVNDRQDSICYELRSQLLDVQLKIKEVKLQMGKEMLLNTPTNNKDSQKVAEPAN